MELLPGSFKVPLSTNGKRPVRCYGFTENVRSFAHLVVDFLDGERAL